MKYLIKNKHWEIGKDYNIDKLLYLLIDRPVSIDIDDDFIWLNSKKLWHRNYDLPADVWHDGIVFWYKNGKRHREGNKSAIIKNNGLKEYYINNIWAKTERI